jgi:hypothetical protein
LPPKVWGIGGGEDDEDTIEVWGDGTAIRSYTYVDNIDSGKIKSIWIPVW